MDYARIGDTCLVGDGTHSKIQRHDSGVLYLTSRNFKDGNLDLSNVYYISESDYAKYFLSESKALACPRPMDLVFSIIGTIGKPYLVRTADRWGISSSVAIVRPNRDVIDPAFLLYWFKGPVFQSALFGIKGGVAQGYVSLEMIRSLPVRVPPLPVQQRIAGILSAYDELIENSQRRIKILDAMARALYREWFVHFRFPGHENHPRVASPLGEIPQGWEVRKLGDVAEDMRRNVPKGGLEEPKPFVGLEHIPRRSLALDAWETTTELGSNKLEFRKGEILFGKIRPYFHKVSVAPFDGLCSADTIVVRSRRPEHYACVVACVSSDAFVSEASATANGAKMPRANWDVLKRYPVVIPDGEVADKFSALTAGIIAQQQALIFQIQNLRRTRDLLLPRLLSGQVALDLTDEDDRLSVAASWATVQAPPHQRTSIKLEADKPEAVPGPRDSTRPIGTIEREEVLCTIRKVFSDGSERDRDTALRDIAYALGYQRLGPRIREELSADFMAAVRRGIIVNEAGIYRLGFRSLADCTRDSLKGDFESAIGRAWITRDEAIRAFARWLGFARVGDLIDQTARSLINGLIREGRVETDGPDLLRRT